MNSVKISVNKNDFLEKLNNAIRFSSGKIYNNPNLQGIMLKKEKNWLLFFSTNLSFYYLGKIKNDHSGEFKIFFEPKKIQEFVSLLDQGEINLEINEKSIIVFQGKNKGEFPLIQTDDFPEYPNYQNLEKQKLEAEFFKKILPLVIFSSSQDDTRPVLTGINFVSKDDVNHIVSTDGFRLSLFLANKEVNLPSVIIPSYFMNEVTRMVKELKEIYFTYHEKEKVLTFFINDDELSTRVIDGEYPPYEKVIPVEKKTTIVLNREDFLKAIKLVSVFARDFSNIVILQTEENGLKISPKNADKETNFSFIDAEIKGEKIKIAFNYRFLIDFLNNFSSKKIIIELLRSDAPAVFKGYDVKNFLHIIMPVRIQE